MAIAVDRVLVAVVLVPGLQLEGTQAEGSQFLGSQIFTQSSGLQLAFTVVELTVRTSGATVGAGV